VQKIDPNLKQEISETIKYVPLQIEQKSGCGCGSPKMVTVYSAQPNFARRNLKRQAKRKIKQRRILM